MVTRKLGLQSQTRTLVLALVCLILVIALGVYWYYRAPKNTSPSVGETDLALSESTRTILRTLQTPVKINYYALLNSASTSDLLRAFAERVDQLLSEYEREAGGKITVVRHANRVDANAASADGIKPFNLAEGEPCFLGMTIVCNDQKETLGQLGPEWEAALESDLTRAIVRITSASPASRAVPSHDSLPDPSVIAEVKRLVPDLASMSLKDGEQVLHDAALKEIRKTMDETERRVKEARQRISQAESSNSEPEKQAALKELQEVQALQTEKLKELATRAQERIQALEQIKSK